ncbi:MAG TPA: AtpZ/AtpI family protein [Phycisphaerae bacterium]|nr:AtpZ/AtpI family protein [Phycisphaerae bacterium]
MGVEFAGALCGLTLLGYWIDRHYGTGRKGVLILGGIGLVGGMYNFIREALELTKETDEESPIHPHEHPHPRSEHEREPPDDR